MKSPYRLILLRHTTVRRVLVFKNPDGEPQDLSSYVFTLFVAPKRGTEFQIDISGSDAKLICDLPAGKITLYISAARLDSYDWTSASYWLRKVDALGDVSRRIWGEIVIREPHA